MLFSFITCEAGYFQQEVKYTIQVSLNDKTHELSANETLIYKNNSAIILKEIYFHLWPAAYKDKNTILAKEIFKSGDNRMLSAEERDLGTIDSLDFKVNGEKVQWNFLEDTIDICKIILNKSLNSGDSISISTPFHVKIPAAFLSRLGHSGQAYFITQWYPKPAVFDENGWNYFPYLDQGEYYSEFGSFDVYITLPENYLLSATGAIVDNDKENTWLTKNDSITRTLKIFPENDSTPLSSKIFKTLHFHQDKVHDFAWFADKRWHVLKNSTILPISKRKITTWAFFNNKEAKYWMKSPEYLQDAIQYYSEWVGEYPYDQVTAVDVGDATGNAMEYPMIAAIGNYGDPFELEITILHETGHNWFYGILGSNERCHPWMDEGINNFYETRYVYTKYKNDSIHQLETKKAIIFNRIILNRKINHRKQQYYGYLSGARINLDQSPNIYADKVSIQNYHPDIYYKTSISFDYLKSYLGDSLFDACMKYYFDQWKFRHPQPDNVKQVFERISGKNLGWIFSDLLNSTKKLDYKIVKAHLTDPNSIELEIKNTGEINGPISLNEIKDNKIISTKWIEGFSGKINITLPCQNCDKYRIDAEERMPELYENNNAIRMHGSLRKTEKLKFSFGISPESGSNTFISYLPVLGWNYYNKFMTGVVIHNISLYEKKFEYRIMPLYATGTKDLEGGGDLSYHLYPKNANVYRVTLRTGISRYAFGYDEYHSLNDVFHYSNFLHFTKFDSRIILSFKQKDRQEHFSNEIILRNILINRDIPYSIDYREENTNILYWQAEYNRKNTNPLKNSLQKLNITVSKNFIKVTGETTNFFTYGEAKKGFGLRLFGGYTSLPEQSHYGIDYRMSLSGRSGINDYLFDEVFLGRSEEKGILSQQFVNDYAGFKTPASFYRLAEKWMFGFNVSTTLPGLLPFRLFANTGVFDNSDDDGLYGKISWEIGIDLPVIKDIFVIYLPFAYSKDIKYAIDQQDLHMGNLIRFELHLNMLNPLDIIKTVYTE